MKRIVKRCRRCGWVKVFTPLGPQCGCTY
ncbi:hypothetical protein SEA_KELA_34 [Streptomyces phage Kela]|nr:hypothetical protein SEA_KELA_34 [Streptomyces phage Kela]